MIQILLIVGRDEFTCRQVRSVWEDRERFRVGSDSNWKLTDSIEEFIHFVNFQLAIDEKQRVEWNEEFALEPESQIPKFRARDEHSGLVDIDRIKFDSGTFAGHIPFSSEF